MLGCVDLTIELLTASDHSSRGLLALAQEVSLSSLSSLSAVSESVAGDQVPEAGDGAQEADDDQEEGHGDAAQGDDDDVLRQGHLQTRTLTPLSDPGGVLKYSNV